MRFVPFAIFLFLILGFVPAFAQDPHTLCKEALLETIGQPRSPVVRTYRRDVEAMRVEQVVGLPALLKRYLILVARDAFNQGLEVDDPETFRTADDIRTAGLAVELFRQVNEQRDEEILFSYYRAANGRPFTALTYYPGAVVGVIYLRDTEIPVARIEDGSVYCVSR